MLNRLKCFIPLLVGLILAQGIATIQVYHTNAAAYQMLSTLHAQGYLTVPNPLTFPALKHFRSALYGGIFYTLTVGFCLSFIAWALSCLWADLNPGKRRIPWLIVMIWVPCIVLVNIRGINWPATAYLLLIPPTVFRLTAGYFYRYPLAINWTKVALVAGAFTLFIIIASFKISSYTYIIIRDHVLLSNSLGSKVNDFYYNYTLYAAQAFKSLDQKIIRTADLSAIADGPNKTQLNRCLLAHDYLPLTGFRTADLVLRNTGDQLHLCHQGAVKMTVPLQRFLQKTNQILSTYSLTCDTNRYFRNYLTGISLLINTGLMVFAIFFAPLIIIHSRYVTSLKALGIGSLLTLATAIGLLYLLPDDPSQTATHLSTPPIRRIGTELASDNWHLRVTTLQRICRNRLDISHFPGYAPLLKSPHVPERYWLARALALSPSRQCYTDLLSLLKDSHFNVVCMAIRGVGLRSRHNHKKKQAITKIIDIINTSKNWYVQRYAYVALRNLGWEQKK